LSCDVSRGHRNEANDMKEGEESSLLNDFVKARTEHCDEKADKEHYYIALGGAQDT
jgi:hypothetical protein